LDAGSSVFRQFCHFANRRIAIWIDPMTSFAFETVDVFTEQRFGGNPLAVFTDARGLTPEQMQALAAEMNLSETTFVLPPEDPANTARVRIFNRKAEMAFAGHPSLGTAYLLARLRSLTGTVALELPAGLTRVALETDGQGAVLGGDVAAPQPLWLGPEVPADMVAACAGLPDAAVLTRSHAPVIASMGTVFVIAEAAADALATATPDLAAFRRAVERYPDYEGRFSLLLYSRQGDQLRARMFAPLAGTWEDPATGSANAPLAGLLLSLTDDAEARFAVSQGVEMGRPSRLRLTARRAADGVHATVGGRCVPVLSGTFAL
jgi:trans-2,3-dihydro-3-hydroxyanthranilate isomerase